MAIRIIDETPDPSVVKQVICRNCGVKLEYVPNDIEVRKYHDYDGHPDSTSFITCPKCRNEIKLK